MEIAAFSILFCAALTGGASEEPSGPTISRLSGPIRQAQMGGFRAHGAPRVIYANTAVAGAYIAGEAGWEWLDWGSIPDLDQNGTVTELSIGYGTTAASTSLRFRIYDDYTGQCTERGVPLLDVSLTGLPGIPGGGVGTGGQGWVVSLDLTQTGDCLLLPEGPFGYSYTFSDPNSGPLFARGGAGQENWIDWRSADGAMCGTLGTGRDRPPPFPWYGFYAGFSGHGGVNTYGVGCGTQARLAIDGDICSGGTLTVTAEGLAGSPAALVVGTSFGPGVGGPIGNCLLDVLPAVPPLVLGRMPTGQLVFNATLGLPPGGQVCTQFVIRNQQTGQFDASAAEVLSVP